MAEFLTTNGVLDFPSTGAQHLHSGNRTLFVFQESSGASPTRLFKVGGNTVVNSLIGSTQVLKIYCGSTLVWEQ